jgi:hypothetical protein
MPDPIELDSYRSSNFLSYHAKIDQYQIYSLAIDDYELVTETTTGEPGRFLYIYADKPTKAEIIAYGSLIESQLIVDFAYDTNYDGYRRSGFNVWGKLSSNGLYYDDIVLENTGGDNWYSNINAQIYIPYNPPTGYTVILSGSEGFYPGLDTPELLNTLPIKIDTGIQQFAIGEDPSNYPPSQNTSITTSIIEVAECVAFQSFSPINAITFDFSILVKEFPKKRKPEITYAKKYWQAIPHLIETYYGKDTASYRDLITGHPLDPRKLPKYIDGIATTSRTIEYKYYRQNKLETHPRVVATIDWFEGKINVIAGNSYRLPIIDPVLGTLIVDEITANELILKNDEYPLIVIRSGNLLALSGLMQYWNTLYSEPDPVDPNYTDFGYNYSVSVTLYPGTVSLPESGIYLGSKSIQTSNPTPRILAANNDRWSKGSNTVNYNFGVTINNLPAELHALFNGLDHQLLFYSQQPNNQIGTYIMDSPRILEIHLFIQQIVKALDAEKYSVNDIDENNPRVTNLGYLIENIARVNGLRLNANGEINLQEEKTKYLPATLNNPQANDKNAYGLTSFGTRGKYLPHLPTSYTNGKEQILHDVVHDIPQLLEAILRQLDISLGIQHGSEIRTVGLDGKIQSYPNQLALNLHLASKIEGIGFTVDRLFNQSSVTAQEVRGLYSGIGIPVTQKFLNLNNASTGKTVQLPYFSHQVNKPSLFSGITDLKVNIGIINGILLPKKQNKGSMLDPFKKFG